MQSRSNGVRTAAANLTSLERERRSKSDAPGRRAPARGEERSLFLLLVGSRRKEKAAADAKQGNGVTGPREQSTTIQCGSERCAVAATAFRALSISVWALGDSERSAFDVGHGQGMLEAGTGLLLSPCCASAATFRSECGEGAFCLGRRRAAGDRLGMRRRRTMPQAGQQYYLLFGS
eukprot:tig00000842_g4865.t2